MSSSRRSSARIKRTEQELPEQQQPPLKKISTLIRIPAQTPPKLLLADNKLDVPDTQKLNKYNGWVQEVLNDASTTEQESPAVAQEAEVRQSRSRTTSVQQKSTYNQDFCDFCHQTNGDELLCCESCPRSFHFCCACPPVSPSSQDHFYCVHCVRSRSSKTRKTYGGLFGELLSSIEYLVNPVVFALPADIRQFFEGVSQDPDSGDFRPSSVKSLHSNTNKARVTRSSNGILSESEDVQLKDAFNKPLICHRCCRSALRGPMIQCDYCPLSWHLDCLDPPMTIAPPASRQWMCPAHANYIVFGDKHRKLSKYAHQIILQDYRIPNNGQIDVHLESDDGFERYDLRVLKTVPEQAIKLAFHDKVLQRHILASEEPYNQENHEVSAIQLDAQEVTLWLESLSHLALDISTMLQPQVASTSSPAKGTGLFDESNAADQLMEIALGSNSLSSSNIIDDDPEFVQFQAWKRLMQLQQSKQQQ